ncbi:hypothetical protein HZA87_03330 [Candidatus Uhrbacteria bacterium]|nr:hypothetical protein [Candidatus Uhrbacteria bacterium]
MFLHEIHCGNCKLNYRSTSPCADSWCPQCKVNGRRDGWLVTYRSGPNGRDHGPMTDVIEKN